MRPDRVALSFAGRRITWAELSEHATRLAWDLRTHAELESGDRVAIALANQPEYLETFYAALKLGCVPVNVDLAHGIGAVHAVLDHSDAKAVVHCGDRAKLVKTAAKRIPKPWRPLLLATGEPYERAVLGAPSSEEWEPATVAADEMILIYNGGAEDPTAAVVWRGADLCAALQSSLDPGVTEVGDATLLPVAPLAHSLGMLPALQALIAGAAVALTRLDPFQPGAVWDAVDRERVTTVSIVSDASARQLADALRAEPCDGTCPDSEPSPAATRVRAASRRALTELLPVTEVVIHDTGPRRVGSAVRVVDDVTGRDVEPGSGHGRSARDGGSDAARLLQGRAEDVIAVPHHRRLEVLAQRASTRPSTPTGSSEAPTRSRRWSMSPDDRVSAPRIEGVLRKHASVARCVVVGVPDPRSGERLVALVEVVERSLPRRSGDDGLVPTRLRPPETPARFLFVDSVTTPTGSAPGPVASRRIAIEMLEQESR